MCDVSRSWTILRLSTNVATAAGVVSPPVWRHASVSMARCATLCDFSSWTWYATNPSNIGRTFAPAGSCGLGMVAAM